MKSFSKLALIVAVALIVPALAMGGGDAAKGKAVYTAKCATCHGPDGEGKDAIAKMMKVEMKPLGSKPVQARTDADIKKIITEGNGKMKPVVMSADDVQNVIAFVRTLAKK